MDPPRALDVVSLDLDGTLIHPAIFNVIADAAGFGAPLLKSYEDYVAGRLTLEDAFWHDYQYFVGRSVAEMHGILQATDRWTPGIREAVADLHDAGCAVWVTTDQPEFLAGFTRRFGVDDVVCTPARVDGDRVTADIRPAFAKWPNLEARLVARGIDPARVAHVGNGTNDIQVFEHVGMSVAVNALHPSVVQAARASIPHVADLREVSRVLLGA